MIASVRDHMSGRAILITRRSGVLGAVFLEEPTSECSVNRSNMSHPSLHGSWVALLVLALFGVSCTSSSESADIPGSSATSERVDQSLFDQDAGTGSFGFEGFGPYPDVPIEVFYSVPDSALTGAPILVVMPGRGRNADDYRDDWLAAARTEGAILIVPEFPDTQYSTSDYNLGHMVDESGDVVSEAEWTFSMVEGLFGYVAEEVKSTQAGFYLYGHSAGGQFVHRFMLFMRDNRVIRAVSANSGWYTVPDQDTDFPYGLRQGPGDKDTDLERMLAQPLTVLLGSEDIDPDADGLRSNAESDEQGATRFDRGFYFFRTGQGVAEHMETAFAWEIEIVNGVGHSNAGMVEEAAAALFQR